MSQRRRIKQLILKIFFSQVFYPEHGYGRRGTEYFKENPKSSFEGQLLRSQHWFAIDIEWLETNFNAR